MKVLIVEDNVNLADVVRMGLSMEGMEAKAVYDGRDALEELDSGEWNMLILDRDLPGVHGDDIARELSERRDPIHILMLTAASQTDDIVRGLDLGADDYLTKPFEYAELLARVNAVRRRLGLSNDMVYRRDGFSVDFRTGTISVHGAELTFGRRELAVLKALIEARGAVMSTERLYREIWQDDHAHTRGIVKTTIYAIRTKIGIPDFIETVPGQGYRIS
ncbi:DNA-binding response regulator [Bifidobacterium rousetti]|uniref:response regulator transcription factor n=1 Tax=Bifidobacterium rousetti TaxID=2045439 RepID=UPI0012392FB5|nr:response regulator transcription factor [Bifidobacterium rousetti]KAA8818061.1 DNA-binding response regulator [Bifidobacterium rousetti]